MMPARMELNFGFGKQTTPTPTAPGNSFNILILGNFSGRVNEGKIGSVCALDMDNFEHTINLLLPTVSVELADSASGSIEIDISSLDDFHPDNLFRKLKVFKDLRELRGRLANPETFAAAAAEFTSGEQSSAKQDKSPPQQSENQSLFESLLDGQATTNTADKRISSNVDNFIHDIVAAHIKPGIENEQKSLLDVVDQSISDTMRNILHASQFQQLESSWRALDRFISRITLDEDIKLFIVDVNKNSLTKQIDEYKDQLSDSILYQRIIGEHTQTLGGHNWSVIIGDFTFSNTATDMQLLAGMGALAQQAGCAFVGGANTQIVGCESLWETPDSNQWQSLDTEFRQDWQQLRQSPMANAIGLVATGGLLRLPYGENTREIDSFKFEEIIDTCNESDMYTRLLWANGAIMCALMMAQSVEQYGPQKILGLLLDVENLPAYTYKCYGQTKLFPCAEVLMTEATAARLLAEGIMSFRSYKDQNKIRLTQLQSIADPARTLSGPW